jgi:hypothetical protein
MHRSIAFVSLVSILAAGVFVVGCSGADGESLGSSRSADSVDPVPPVEPPDTDAAPPAPGQFPCGFLPTETCDGTTNFCERQLLTPIGPVRVDPAIVTPILAPFFHCMPLPSQCTGANATCACIETALAASVSPPMNVSFSSCTDNGGDVTLTEEETRRFPPGPPFPPQPASN